MSIIFDEGTGASRDTVTVDTSKIEFKHKHANGSTTLKELGWDTVGFSLTDTHSTLYAQNNQKWGHVVSVDVELNGFVSTTDAIVGRVPEGARPNYRVIGLASVSHASTGDYIGLVIFAINDQGWITARTAADYTGLPAFVVIKTSYIVL